MAEKVHKTIGFPQETWKMLEALKPLMGQSTMNGVIFAIVAEAYQKRNPAYAKGKNTGETKAEREAREKQERIDEKMEFVKQLEGEIVEINGIPHVKYFTYSRGSRYQQTLPVEQVDADIVARQYDPSKEVVMKYREDGRAKY